jgi:hypothetical protein
VFAPQKCVAVYGRAQKGCSLIVMLSMQLCIETTRLSLRKRASGTVKVFSLDMASRRFFGTARRRRAQKNAHNSSKNQASCAAHVMRVVAEEFWAHAFLKSTSTDFGGGGLVQAVLERPCERW